MVLSQFINLSTTSSELREHANPVGASVGNGSMLKNSFTRSLLAILASRQLLSAIVYCVLAADSN
jgi:hypothetical protein